MNKHKDALTYLRNSVLATDHKQKERVNQCKEVLQELIDKTIDEKGNLKVFASICIDEDKMKKKYAMKHLKNSKNSLLIVIKNCLIKQHQKTDKKTFTFTLHIIQYCRANVNAFLKF